MASILTNDQALPLDVLLAKVDTEGLSWQLLPHMTLPMPLIRGIGPLSEATPHDIAFLSNPKFFQQLQITKAAAVILPQRAIDALPKETAFHIIQCEDPYLFFARLTQWFEKQRFSHHTPFIDPRAAIDSTATIGQNVRIHPFAVIQANAVIGDNVTIGAGSVVGEGSIVGDNTVLNANVTLYHSVEIGKNCIIHSGAVLGADGFGFAPDSSKEKGAWSKIAQLGKVIIEDDVEIGANTTIDRGALGNTIIHRGVKLDNQIMIGHNCEIGEHSAMAACVGIAGSSKVGKRCTLAGAAMMSGHIKLGDDVHISGGSGVMSDIEKPGRYTGIWPISDHQTWQKNAATLANLYELRRRIQALEKLLANDEQA